MSKPSRNELDVYADENLRVAAYQRAKAALAENTAREAAAGITHETREYQRLNQAVIDAEQQLPKRFKKAARRGL
ncbi:hypothetical protein ADL07_11665 [Streptomyces sp. NRRL F-4707]|uniref:hypothetical protein n=1 Tax=Streptomyces TaxID=1883 RepID=UPI0006AE608A|nr:hypothetical protein [Streptomyces sp. NRRL F-4707]KOX32818.1 hypothetical protein ADL07_11665 [Streptomyces sp. NRRL F-4707]